MMKSGRKTNLLIGAFLALSPVVGLLNVPAAYADEGTPEASQETAAPAPAPSDTEEAHAFQSFDYQGKKDLKEYWNTVQSDRTEISEMRSLFDVLEPSEERWAQVDGLIAAAQKETDLDALESTKAELNGLLDTWAQEIVAASAVPVASYSGTSGGGSYYSNAIQSGVLTRSGGVNSYDGRTETWYSQNVLPGGGLNIPGRHVAEDGTIRDGDGYIVVAASDLAYGSTVDTSLGAGKVYDTGCASGVTDIYTNW